MGQQPKNSIVQENLRIGRQIRDLAAYPCFAGDK